MEYEAKLSIIATDLLKTLVFSQQQLMLREILNITHMILYAQNYNLQEQQLESTDIDGDYDN